MVGQARNPSGCPHPALRSSRAARPGACRLGRAVPRRPPAALPPAASLVLGRGWRGGCPRVVSAAGTGRGGQGLGPHSCRPLCAVSSGLSDSVGTRRGGQSRRRRWSARPGAARPGTAVGEPGTSPWGRPGCVAESRAPWRRCPRLRVLGLGPEELSLCPPDSRVLQGSCPGTRPCHVAVAEWGSGAVACSVGACSWGVRVLGTDTLSPRPPMASLLRVRCVPNTGPPGRRQRHGVSQCPWGGRPWGGRRLPGAGDGGGGHSSEGGASSPRSWGSRRMERRQGRPGRWLPSPSVVGTGRRFRGSAVPLSAGSVPCVCGDLWRFLVPDAGLRMGVLL